MARVTWIGQAATAKDSKVDSLSLLNGYAELVESRQGKATVAIYGTPGLKLFATLPGSGPIRGMFSASNGRCFVVQGTQFFELFQTGSANVYGTLRTSSGPVVMDDNGVHLMAVDGPTGYTLTFSSGAFAQIQDADFVGADRVVSLNNYFLLNKTKTQQFYWTDPLGIAFAPLDFASAEGFPDWIRSLLTAHSSIWLFGDFSTEVWGFTGNANAPFARVPSAFIQYGIAAPHSATLVGETVCWIAANKQGRGLVMQANGYTPERISTHAVETAIQRYPVIDDALGWCEQREGHLFYWLTFPTANATWVYDATAGLWHTRGAMEPTTGQIGRHRANCHVLAFGNKHLVGDYENGHIYELDPETYSDNGDALVFEATMPPLFDADGLHRVAQRHLRLDCKVGIGLDGNVVPGSAPVLMLRLSNDGGATWPIERTASLGASGRTHTLVDFRQLGSGYDRRCRIRITDPVPRVILGAVTDVEVFAR